MAITDIDWFRDHLALYQKDPARAHDWDASPVGGVGVVPTLLLQTTGAKSGVLRELPLLYQPCGTGFIVVASRGGSARHPGWYLNLLANPECSAQVGVLRYSLSATTLTGDERSIYWEMMTRFWPAYLDYQARTEREIPIVRLAILGSGSLRSE
ncbi:MAG: nitroreductase family deazaflavin-dependent oxidoreductase [Pseudomonadales bacterium]